MFYQLKRSTLTGSLCIPPSKSHTLRAILFASLATGKSVIRNYLDSPDTQAMITACQLLGARIQVEHNILIIHGVSGKPKHPSNIIDVGNSGQVLRFVGAVSALTEGYTVLTGDHSIRTNRPVHALLEGLQGLHVFAVSTKNDGHAPIIIKGPIQPGVTSLNGEDSQPVSGLLIATAFAPGPSLINVNDPGEKPWVDLTLAWFDRLGLIYQREGYTQYRIAGNAQYAEFDYVVPGDFSSAAYPIVAALITHSEITLSNIDMNDCQGDKALISILENMGAQFEIDHSQKIVKIKKSNKLSGITIDANNLIDAVPILAVLGCFSSGETQITNAAIARKKESDRLSSITTELRKMGAQIKELPDGLIIQESSLHGTHLKSHQDHRIAMSLAVAAFASKSETLIEDTHCVAKSFPHFAESFCALGANIKVTP